MPPGELFAVYDSKTGNPDYIPPEYCDIPGLLDELVEYVNTTDDHPLIIAAVVHYQLVTIHPFERLCFQVAIKKQYKTTNSFTNTTNLKLFVEYKIAIIKSQDLGKQKNEKRLRFYEDNWQ